MLVQTTVFRLIDIYDLVFIIDVLGFGCHFLMVEFDGVHIGSVCAECA